MDKGKVRRLRWSELDLDRADGRVVTGRFAMQRDKTGKPIRQELSDGAVEALNRAGKVRHASGVVFLDADAHPIEEKVLDWALGCAYKAAKITGCNFRTFRHTFATRALAQRAPRGRGEDDGPLDGLHHRQVHARRRRSTQGGRQGHERPGAPRRRRPGVSRPW